MTTSGDRAAELRALADRLDVIDQLESALRDAKEAYRADPSEETKATHREAAEALQSARAGTRGSGLLVGSNEPGSVTISPAGIAGKVT